jgi:hypothetical protein
MTKKFVFIVFVTATAVIAADVAHARVRPVRDAISFRVAQNATLDVTIEQNRATTDVKDRALTGNAEQDSFDVPHSSDVTIVLTNPNPLLYKYEVRDKSQTPLASFTALKTFGESVAKLQETLGGLAGGVRGGTESAPPTAADRAAASRPACGASTKLGTIAVSVKKNLGEIKGLLIKSEADPNELQKDTNWKLANLRAEYNTTAAALHQGAADVLATTSDDLVVCKANVALALALLPVIGEGLEKLEDFEKLAKTAGKDRVLDTVAIDRMNSNKFTIHIERNDDNWPEGLKPTRFIGDRSVSIAPYEAIPVSLAPMMVYSRVEDGTDFVIEQTKTEVTGLDLAASLLFAPRALDFTTFDLVFQVGVSPQKDLGFFIGPGFEVRDMFTIGAGLAYQRVNELAGDLTPGQHIATEDALKIDKAFRSGVYFFITTKVK